MAGDLNNNNEVDFFDFSSFVSTYNLNEGDSGYIEEADFNNNLSIDFLDFSIFVSNYLATGDTQND